MKILFYFPSSGSLEPEPPLGIAMLMSVSRNLGHEVFFYDFDHHRKLHPLVKFAEEVQPDLIAISFMTSQYFAARKDISMFREKVPSAKIIVGGAHPSSLPEDTMQENPGIDFLCVGEGEKTFEEFLQKYASGQGVAGVRGLYFRNDNRVVGNEPRELMSEAELIALPMPSWDIVYRDGLYYGRPVYSSSDVPVFPVMTARGCPYRCAFCDEGTIWKRKLRYFDVERCVQEIAYLYHELGARHFNILDDTFTVNPKRVEMFCNLIKENQLEIQWRVTAKVNTVNLEMLKTMAASGCLLIAYGVESGSQKVLDRMHKQQTIDQIHKAFALTKKAGLLAFALCMVGNFGETFEDVKKTARLLADINADIYSCSIMTPYPGSENYRLAMENGWIQHLDWEQFVPTPIRLRNYRPICRTDTMSGEEILKSYYYLNRYLLLKKYRIRYGPLFFVNPGFFKHEILSRLKRIGFNGLWKHVKGLIGYTRRKEEALREDGFHECPLCGETLFGSYPRANLLRCFSCNLILSPNIWQQDANLNLEEQWFEDGYINSSSFWVKIFENLNNRRTWNRISPFVKQGCKLLEIGVGSGSFLAYARKRALNVMGCDLSKAICQDVQKRLNIPMFNGFVANLPKKPQYDVAVMNHVLEHVDNPLNFLKDVCSRLNNNGLLHVVVPNVASWDAVLPGWVSYEPYHLTYFTPETLRQVLEKAGFKVIQVTTHESFSGWFLAVLRTLLSTQNAAVSQRQTQRQARKTSLPEHAYRIAMVVSGVVFFPLRYIQAKLGFGDEVAVLAVPDKRR